MPYLCKKVLQNFGFVVHDCSMHQCPLVVITVIGTDLLGSDEIVDDIDVTMPVTKI